MKRTHIYTDFNDGQGDGTVRAHLRDADGPMTLGDPVVLQDEEGNRVIAAVERVEPNGLVFGRPDWTTWNQVVEIDFEVEYSGVPNASWPSPFDPGSSGLDRESLPEKRLTGELVGA